MLFIHFTHYIKADPMNPSKILKHTVYAVVIASATAGSFSSTAQEVTLSIPSAKTVLRSAYKTIKKISPYALTIGYFCWIEPRIVENLPTKTIYTDPKTEKKDKGLATGVKKVLDVFVGASLISRMKEDAEWLDKFIFGTIDSAITPAA